MSGTVYTITKMFESLVINPNDDGQIGKNHKFINRPD